MENLAVLSLGEKNEEKASLLMVDRSLRTPSAKVVAYKELGGKFYELLENGNVDDLALGLEEGLKGMPWQGRFFYITLPDSMVSYKCFTRSKSQAFNLKKKGEYETFAKMCLKENADKKNPQEYSLSFIGEGRDEINCYYSCAYASVVAIKTLQMVFAKLKLPLYAIEANFNGAQRLMRLSHPQGALYFAHQGNYFLSERNNVFSIFSSQEDSFTNRQVLLALRQKSFGDVLRNEDMHALALEDLAVLPSWISSISKDETRGYLFYSGLGSGLRGLRLSTGKGEQNVLGKLRKLFVK